MLTLLKSKISKTYVKLFAQIPSPKDEIINYIIFVSGYNIHWLLWKHAKDQRDFMDLRFVFDCYHILVFSLNGIYVSDSYIRLQIEKIFSSRFMDYEREKKEKLLMQKIELRKKQSEKTFLDKKIIFPDINKLEGGSEFNKQLTDKFKLKKSVIAHPTEELTNSIYYISINL